MFLLVGKELVKAQETSGLDHTLRDSWKYTQNWIAYEVGLACQRGLDVWVVCDNVEINFPVPYLSNYSVGGLYSSDEDETGIGFMREILENYKRGSRFLLGALKRNISCPNDDCKAMFNLHSVIPKGGTVVCPTCLQTMTFDGGWLIK